MDTKYLNIQEIVFSVVVLINKEKIRRSVVSLFEINMGLKNGEKVLVVADVPTLGEWNEKSITALTDFAQRTLLAKVVSEIATESFPECLVEFYVYLSVGRHGAELRAEVAEKLKTANVVNAITTYSLSHTKAREDATEAGARIASMPMFLIEMLYPKASMAADYTEVKEESEKVAKLLTNAKKATVKTSAGTNITFSLEGRDALADTGIFTEKGAFGNLPSGEAYIAPVEKTGEGRVVVEKGWHAGLTKDMTFVFKGGEVVEIASGGNVGDEFRDLLKPWIDEEPYKSRRKLAELGIGTNPYAKRPDNVLEAEKIKGTIHIAVGDNSHFGGGVSADLHQDFIIPRSTLLLDGKAVIKDGKWLF